MKKKAAKQVQKNKKKNMTAVANSFKKGKCMKFEKYAQ